MASFNNVVLMGNLTRDPELKYTAAGAALATMGLAMNRRWRDKNEQLKEETTFVDVTAWGKTADIAAKYLKKGEPVLIEGRLRYSTWDAKEGGKRSKLDVVAEGLRLLPRRGGGAGDPVGPFGPGSPGAGEFQADAATAFEDAEEAGDPFDGPPFGGGMPSGRS